MHLLHVENLTKTFKKDLDLFGDGYFHAVENVSFTLDAGKTLAIIGRNGSGKSMLAKMIVGITEPPLIHGLMLVKYSMRRCC